MAQVWPNAKHETAKMRTAAAKRRMTNPPSMLSGAGANGSGRWLVKLGDWLFLAWVALIPVMQPNLTIFNRFSLQAADVVFVPAAVVYVALLLSGKRQLRLTPLNRCAMAFLAALILSTCLSENRWQSFLKLLADTYLIFAAVMAESYIANLEALRRTTLAWIAGTAVTIAAAAAGVMAFYYSLLLPAALRSSAATGPLGAIVEFSRNTFIDDYGTAPPGPYPRICACFLYADGLCAYAIASAMIVVAAHQAGWIGRRTSQALFWGAAMAALFSPSPGMGGLFLAMGLWYWRQKRSNPASSPHAGRYAASAGALAAVAFLLVATISPTPLRTSSVWETLRHPQPSVRDLTWTGAWRTFLSHPLFGRGLDLPEADVYYLAASGEMHHQDDAHNTWLSIMAQAGLPATIAFAAIMLTLTRRFRWRSADSHPALAALDLAFISGVLYPLLTASFESTRHVWLMIALVAAAHRVLDAESRKPPRATCGPTRGRMLTAT